ncbi:MAG TPA: selenocysteine-specific translation elongation factor [Bacillota bacterium]|nr:selenocysteine-specific translation elongation factor [Bacillota bacterium]
MEHLVIGTAGHVDHGKTVLIKALTGVDTDRLEEEKKRGISIDLGFAPLEIPGVGLAGVVDVPGHERFIHNMLAGAAGMDLVLLVIDANEGVMPQTREHLQILQLLGVRKGIVVLTKIDLVDEEWRELVREEVAGELKGTFLEGAPLHEVSALTGEGIEELKELIAAAVRHLPPRDKSGPLRLPVDRSFTIAGFGTVVTGTLFRGRVKVGGRVEIVPPGREARVRNIQVHGRDVERAEAGQRVALNLAGVEKWEIHRGCVVASPGYYRTTKLIDASLTLLPSAPRPLKNLDPVHFFLGTARVVARLLLLDRDELPPGEDAIVQCRLQHPLVADRGDPFIIRSYSPMTTIGGGRVLDPAPSRHRRFRRESFAHLEQLAQEPEAGGDEAFVYRKLEELLIADPARLAREVRLEEGQVKEILEGLLQKGAAVKLGESYLPQKVMAQWEERLLRRLEDFHRRHPLRAGISRAELKGALPAALSLREYDLLLAQLQERGKIVLKEDLVSGEGFAPRPSAEEQAQLDRLAEIYAAARFQPPSAREALARAGIDSRRQEDYYSYLVNRGRLVKINEELYFHREAYDAAIELLRRHFAQSGTITLAQFRDLTGSSRKIMQLLLEHFDGLKLTRRVGDYRVPLKL